MKRHRLPPTFRNHEPELIAEERAYRRATVALVVTFLVAVILLLLNLFA